MSWSIVSPPESPLLEVHFTGVLTPPELVAAVSEVVRRIRTLGNGCVLADLTFMAGGHSLFDLYHVIESLLREGVPSGFREAVVLPGHSEMLEKAAFWETACRNRGLDVRLFSDGESARQWLQSR